MCQQYREKVMLLVDNELPDSEKADIEEHLRICPECLKQFQEFRRLSITCGGLAPRAGAAINWSDYYQAVCRKMHRQTSYRNWALASLGLVLAGNLMFYSFPGSIPGYALGTCAILAGIGMLWMSYFCNCKR